MNHLTVLETAEFADIPSARIEKACEQNIVQKTKIATWRRGRLSAHVPISTVTYFKVLNSLEGFRLERSWKVQVWNHVNKNSLETLELSRGVSLDVALLAGDAWQRAHDYLLNRDTFLTVDPDILGGEPVIKGTRISCRSVQGRIRDGYTIDDLRADYPDIEAAAFETANIYARTHPPRGRPSERPRK